MHPLAAKITALQRRLLLRERAVAVCRTMAVVLAAVIVLGLLDYGLRYVDRGLRVMATLALAAVIVWAAYRWWYLPRTRWPTALTVARRIETRFPQLHDSLASAVEFLQQSEEDVTAGSPQLRRIVVAEAETAVERLALEEVVERGPLRRAAVWCGVACAALMFCLLVDAHSVGTAVARLVAPLANIDWPRQHYLEFQNPPTRLAVGDTFDAALVDRSGELPPDVRIDYRIVRDGRRQIDSQPMLRSGEKMTARRENVRHSFSFRAEGGDDRTMRWIDVEVVEPPRVETLTATLYPPDYSRLPAAAAERFMEVLAGSRLEITGVASQPLAAARLLVPSGNPIPGTIGQSNPQSAIRNPQSQTFQISSTDAAITTAGAYGLELESADEVSGVVATWQLRVEPDPPPTVIWQQPAEDLHVLPSAAVPIELVARDNLAIRRVDLVIETAGAAVQDTPVKVPRLELYAGPEQPAASTNDARTLAREWPLKPLELSPGDQVMLRAEAADYRPGVGQTSSPRRITIITMDELDARLAEQQTQIVRQLERVLTAERAAREEVRRVEIQHRDAGALSPSDRNALAAAELNQRRVGWMLADAAEGLPAMVDQLLAELTMNGVQSPDVERAMRQLQGELKSLAGGPLGAAERELTAARKIADANRPNDVQSPEPVELPPPQIDAAADRPASPATADDLGRSLSAAGEAQDAILGAVERLIGQLSDAKDFSRYVRELTELRRDQATHAQATQAEIDPRAIPLEPDELSREQRAVINTASAAQDTIARRFLKTLQGLRELSARLDLQDAAASTTLQDVVALAEELSIAQNMGETTRDLAENRVARALDRERQIADDLEKVLDLLRDRTPEREALANELRQAEQELAALRGQLAALREQAARADAQSNRDERQRLGRRQEELHRAAERLARQMQRLEADAAGRSTQQAADRLDNRPPVDNAAPPQPATDEQLAQAEQKLEEAARELAERRAQAELDLALEFINRFRESLEQMIARQERVLTDTFELDAARRAARGLSAADAGRLEALAAEERALVQQAVANRELLMGLGAVRVSLEEAERRLTAAAELLAGGESGRPAQNAERRALARLNSMMEAFAQTAAEARKPPEGGNQGGGNNPNQPPGRRPAFELLEVKMLRMLQVELNARTDQYEERLTAAGPQPNEAQRAELAREAQQLAAEQRRLAELVNEMLSRNNRRQQGE
jgi:hypothetical protein